MLILSRVKRLRWKCTMLTNFIKELKSTVFMNSGFVDLTPVYV